MKDPAEQFLQATAHLEEESPIYRRRTAEYIREGEAVRNRPMNPDDYMTCLWKHKETGVAYRVIQCVLVELARKTPDMTEEEWRWAPTIRYVAVGDPMERVVYVRPVDRFLDRMEKIPLPKKSDVVG